MALEGKTLAQCRNFFTNYKRKLNLPKLIAEYEIKNVSEGRNTALCFSNQPPLSLSQGYKLSRYSRQARDQVENGVQYPEEQPQDPKRACYESRPPQAHYPLQSQVPMAGLV